LNEDNGRQAPRDRACAASRFGHAHGCCHLGLRRKVARLCADLDLFGVVLSEPLTEADCPVRCPHGVTFWVREIPGFYAPGQEFWAARL